MVNLAKNPIIYVARDIERALGLPHDTPGFSIISNETDFGKTVAKGRSHIHLIPSPTFLDTAELLEHPETKKIISQTPGASILVFKNTERIELVCRKNGWKLLNPSASLASRVEEKISQVEWLDSLASYLPPHKVLLCKDIVWRDTPFILQFNRAHTGTGTLFVTNKKQLEDIQDQFPDRPSRLTQFVDGPVFTSNNVVSADAILIGNISYQITGLEPFTDNPFATIGNDWELPKKLLDNRQLEKYREIVMALGEKLRADGWKGLFGTDMIVDSKTGKLYLLEINARQPASTTFESKLQSENTIPKTITTFAAHLAGLTGESLSSAVITPITSGAQIILRNRNHIQTVSEAILDKLRQHFFVIRYPNTKPGTDLVRIQHTGALMSHHNQLNATGQEIATILATTARDEHAQTLSEPAMDMIRNYLRLPFQGHAVACPYYNNKRKAVRAALRVTIGKGTPEDIVQEAVIFSLKEKIDLQTLIDNELSQFLISHHLGVDCSGLAFHVLNAEVKARGKSTLAQHITFPSGNWLRRIIQKFRPAENTDVTVLSDDKNSIPVALADVRPGDLIIMKDVTGTSARDHVLIIHDVSPRAIHYTHSLAWSSDGATQHGVRQGTILIVDEMKNLLAQQWEERGKTGDTNETLLHAARAKTLEIRRLHALK